MCPWLVAAAAFTAQWHAELTSQSRPGDMSSKAPLWTIGTSSVVCTEDVTRLLPETRPFSTRARLIPAEQSAHAIQLDQPDLVVAAIRETLAQSRNGDHTVD